MENSRFRLSDADFLNLVGKISYYHNNVRSGSSAFEIDEKARIEVSMPRIIGAYRVRLIFYDEYQKTELFSLEPNSFDFVLGFDVYNFNVPIKKILTGLYYFSIEISSIFGIIYLYKNKSALRFSKNKPESMFQLSISDFEFSNTSSYLGGVIYHIFVDRFYRGDSHKIHPQSSKLINWQDDIPEYPVYAGAPIKNDYLYGGTLFGIEDKLEYISSLGVNLIYLSPIFKSPSNHKYDTSDYMRVDESFGGEIALRSLIRKARKHGISIILDGVFNHTGDDSIYFNKYKRFDSVGAYESKDSEYYSWYEFKEHPDDYVCWWGIKILPRINPDVRECRDYFVSDNGVIDKYSKMGIAGFRLDVADELSDGFISAIKKKLCENNTQSILYGEVWEDGSNKIAYGIRKKYYLGKELDGVMNYPIRSGIISFLRYGDTEPLRYALTEIIYNSPKRIRDMQMNLLGSHDTVRILTALGGEEPHGNSNRYLRTKCMSDLEYKKGKALLLSAYTVLATLPGIPCIYYGDEVGVQGYSDPFNRKTFPWGNEDVDILEHYKRIGSIRRENSVYKNGEYSLLYLDSSFLIFARLDKKSLFITLVNNGDKDVELKFTNVSTELISGKKSRNFLIKKANAYIFKTSKNSFMELIN